MRILTDLSGEVSGLAIHETIVSSEWLIPALQSVHILAIAVVFASSLIISLSCLGLLSGTWPPVRWSYRLNGWIWTSLVVLLISGALLVVGEPERSLLNWAFQAKMLLVLLAALILTLLTSSVRQTDDGSVNLPEKVLAALLVVIWILVISAGRWIAYT